MDTKINFDFVSPEESIVSSEVDMVLIPAIEGDAGILPNHAPYMTILRPVSYTHLRAHET